MREFNLEEAKAGAEVCTREGRNARIICFDVKGDCFKIVALIEYECDIIIESPWLFYENGRSMSIAESKNDLMMKN